jgi:argininosuccinate lyase
MLKGLPLTYSKDMQEDKEPTFEAADTLELALAAMIGMVLDLQPNAARMREVAAADYSVATDLADWLVRQLDLPFRRAHHVTGQIVALAARQGVALDALELAEMQKIEPGITRDIFKALTVEASVAARRSFGGTAPRNVRSAVLRARKRFSL